MQRGSNLDGVRRYNQRLALATIRRRNGASKTDIANATGLSPQGAVRIVDALEEAGLIVRTGKRTGGMGQPSIIYEVNGNGGFTVGVEVGRERITLLLLNYRGEVMDRHVHPVRFPSPEMVLSETSAFVKRQLGALPEDKHGSFLGIGIAMPWFMGEWRQEIGISEDQARQWQREDLEALFRSNFKHPVYFENDGNAGALAELLNGAGLKLQNFLYLHVGTFVGGGLVLGSQLVEGQNGNAGAIASMPVPSRSGDGLDFLIHRASLYTLEEMLGCSSSIEGSLDVEIGRKPEMVAAWIEDCASSLAFAIMGVNSLLDLPAILIGGDLEQPLIASIIEALRARLAERAPPDFFMPDLIPGAMGAMAAATGAGLLPMYATFSPNLSALLKSDNA